MLGISRDVQKLLFKDKFPFVIPWHCANHGLELSVHDVLTKILGINRFTPFIE